MVSPNASRLRAGSNRQFWEHSEVASTLSGALLQTLRSDYEYTLWMIYLRSRSVGREALLAEVGDRYPEAALVEYNDILSGQMGEDERKSSLSSYIKKYEGRGMAFLAEGYLLDLERSSLDIKDASSAQWRTYYEKLRAFEKRRASLTGLEATIAKGASKESAIKSLLSSEIEASVEKGEILVRLRNLSKATVEVCSNDGKSTLRKYSLKNTANSFYVWDTLKVELPLLDDGRYAIKARGADATSESFYSSHTLSLAYRHNSDGIGVFVTDYRSGEPLSSVTISVERNGSPVLSETLTLKDGFTTLPASLQETLLSGDRVQMHASLKEGGRTRLSPSLTLHDRNIKADPYQRIDTERGCLVFTDKGAYNPGETLSFKCLLYEMGMDGERDIKKAVESGAELTATLLDPSSKEVARMSLRTGEWGSASGEFSLPSDCKGGRYEVRISSKDGRHFSGAGVVVDEFVLPSFEISFDRIDRVYLQGDKVDVTGTVKAYSGHSLSGARASWSASYWNDKFAEGELEILSDGSFHISFPTDQDRNEGAVVLTLKVVDPTGETQEGTKRIYLHRNIYLGIYLTPENGISSIKDDPSWTVILQNIDRKGDVEVLFSLNTQDGGAVPVPVEYSLLRGKDEVVLSGSATSGTPHTLSLGNVPSGVYTLKARTSIKGDSRTIERESERTLLLGRTTDRRIDPSVEYLVSTCSEELSPGEDIHLRLASGTGPVWAAVELYGEGMTLLESRLVEVASAGDLVDTVFKVKDSYPSQVLLNILFFRDSRAVQHNVVFRRKAPAEILPLEFSTFSESTVPGTRYTFTLRSVPGAEILASVYDKSVDRINPLGWGQIWTPYLSIPYVGVNAVSGRVATEYPRIMMSRGAPMASRAAVQDSAVNFALVEEAVEEEAIPFSMASKAAKTDADYTAAGSSDPEEEHLRENFATTLAFEPHILTDGKGEAGLSFTTSDKLSTFVVSLFAHTRDLRNATLRKEFTVTIPVKASMTLPQYLYNGDTYSLSAGLSSQVDRPIRGTLTLYQYEGGDYNTEPISRTSRKVSLPANSTIEEVFPVKVPSNLRQEGVIGLKLVFSGEGFSDSVFDTIPVYLDRQVITESHSGVLLPGMDRERLLEEIKSSFVNVSPFGATSREITVIDMVRDAIPDGVEPKGKDVLSLSEALYMRLLADRLLSSEGILKVKGTYRTSTDELVQKILDCRNADGGFGWYQGMSSSPIISAVLLERIHKMHTSGLLPDGALYNSTPSTVRWLDTNRFETAWPLWCGGLSDAQYIYVRSLYPEVPFDLKDSSLQTFEKRMKEFRTYVKDYLVPGDDRGLQGQILAKARRLATLTNLLSSERGVSLAGEWGVKLSPSRMKASLQADVESLLQYAVDHRNGGMYYPNAVLPYRGLLESEAYAHSMLCDLLSSYDGVSKAETKRIADGLRIWMMLQKETQQWSPEPAFVDAINSVLSGDETLHSTSVLLLSKTYEAPLSGVRKAGNGMTIERRFFREVTIPDKRAQDQGLERNTTSLEEILPGQILQKGDKIIAQYSIANDENRSFVRLTAPREATLRPIEQLSGHWGWGIGRIGSGGFYYRPSAYREVEADRTVYSFDSYPEEKTVVSEAFYVTQTGSFQAPVVTIESQYAPHYRANDSSPRPLTVK